MARFRRGPRVAGLALAGALLLLMHPARVRAAAGDLDPGFSPDETLTTAIPGAAQAAARAVVELPDGKLLVAGTAGGAGTFGVVLVRYLDDGALDPSFGGGDGVVFVDLGGNVAPGPVGLARRADGALFVAATLLVAGAGDFVVARLDATGALSAGFGSGGRLVLDLGGDDRVSALALDALDRPVVVGQGGASNDFAVVRADATGAPDASFSGDGVVLTDASGAGRADRANDVTIRPDGRIVVVGEASNGTDLDFALARYDDRGALDDGFGDHGIVRTSLGTEPFSTNDDRARAVVLLPDGRIVVAGQRNAMGFFRIALVRYDASGQRDPDFGNAGIAFAGDGFGEGLVAADVVREPGGRLVTTGHYVSNQILGVGFPAVVRFTSRGALDASFGDGGVSLFGRPGHLLAIDEMYALLRDAAGRLVTVGKAQDFPPTSPSLFAIARLDGGRPCDAPLPDCSVSTRPRRSTLTLQSIGHAVLNWQWRSGEQTTRESFGDPVRADDYTLCLFGADDRPLLAARAPTGDCGPRPCWNPRPSGYLYRDGARTPDGIASIRLHPATEGRAAVGVVARGPLLDLPALPLAAPVTVQLQATSGGCWESVFPPEGVTRNDGTRFVARGAP